MSKSEEVQSTLLLHQVQEVHCRCCNSECSRKNVVQIGIYPFPFYFSVKDFQNIAISNKQSKHECLKYQGIIYL